MRLMNIIKEVIPSDIRNVIKMVIYRSRFHYSHPMKNERMTVVFLVNRTNIFNSVKSIYLSMKNDSTINTYLIALPDRSSDKLSKDTKRVLSYCMQLSKEQVIDSWDNDNQCFFDVKQLNPDFVFLGIPYDEEYPNEYSFNRMASFTKLCFVPYGFDLVTGVGNQTSLNDYMLAHVSYLFADSDVTAEYCNKRMKILRLFGKYQVCDLGFPRFDLLEWKKEKDNTEKTVILYTPRWTTSRNVNNGHEPSSFLRFINGLLSFGKNNPEFNIIIRPHPILFSRFVSDGEMTIEEVALFRDQVEKTTNMQLDEEMDYLNSLMSADILLTDYSSVVTEFLYTKKPVVYYGPPTNFVNQFKPLYDAMYVVENWDQAEATILALSKGLDNKKQKRKDAVDKCLLRGKKSDSGVTITRFLKDEYCNNK